MDSIRRIFGSAPLAIDFEVNSRHNVYRNIRPLRESRDCLTLGKTAKLLHDWTFPDKHPLADNVVVTSHSPTFGMSINSLPDKRRTFCVDTAL